MEFHSPESVVCGLCQMCIQPDPHRLRFKSSVADGYWPGADIADACEADRNRTGASEVAEILMMGTDRTTARIQPNFWKFFCWQQGIRNFPHATGENVQSHLTEC